MESTGGSPARTSIDSQADSENSINNEDAVNTEVWRSKTLRRFGIGHILLGCLGIFLRLGCIVTRYKFAWMYLVPGLFCSLLEIPLGILGFAAGTNLEDRCYLITSNVLSVVLALFGFSNIALQAIVLHEDTSKVIYATLLIALSATVGILSVLTAYLCSRYTFRDRSSCCCMRASENDEESHPYRRF